MRVIPFAPSEPPVPIRQQLEASLTAALALVQAFLTNPETRIHLRRLYAPKLAELYGDVIPDFRSLPLSQREDVACHVDWILEALQDIAKRRAAGTLPVLTPAGRRAYLLPCEDDNGDLVA